MVIETSARRTALAVVASLTFAAGVTPAAGDTLVNVGSPTAPFSQNKQNEPGLAVDQAHPGVLAAGANDNIDLEACNAGDDTTCPFTLGVGVSGVYLSLNSGASWTQPAYRGYSARGCLGAVGNADPGCTPQTGTIGTVPNYDSNGLISDGDPALAFGPVYRNGAFSSTDTRLYYANLTSAFPGASPFKGAEAIAVSHTDDVAAAKNGTNAAWSAPVIASKQNGAKFSDKEQIWADNARSSPYFGNVYVCYAAFRGNGNGVLNQPLDVLRSTDGGANWTDSQVTPAASNTNSRNGWGRSGCTVRTDSRGMVYVFDYQFGYDPARAAAGKIEMITSTDGGAHWSRPVSLFTAYDTCNAFEPSIGRCVEDGVGGARSDLSPAPSVDIANGAPGGGDATDRIVMTWIDGGDGLNHERVMFSTAKRGGTNWSAPTAIERPGDRGYYAAASIAPNGSDVYLVYNAFATPFRFSAVGPGNDRRLGAVVLHADATSGGVGAFSEMFRSATGDARASSQNNLAAEFLGDYVYAVATRTRATVVWNDVRHGADCPAIDGYRQGLHDAAVTSGAPTAEAEEPGDRGADAGATSTATPARPAPQQDCPAGFGNTDIYGATFNDPTP